jgi:hypothetical protein
MFVKLEKLEIINSGHKRDYFLRPIFINADTVVSVSKDEEITSFLQNEAPLFVDTCFSNVRVTVDHNNSTSITVKGTPESIAESLNGKKEILHG